MPDSQSRTTKATRRDSRQTPVMTRNFSCGSNILIFLTANRTRRASTSGLITLRLVAPISIASRSRESMSRRPFSFRLNFKTLACSLILLTRSRVSYRVMASSFAKSSNCKGTTCLAPRERRLNSRLISRNSSTILLSGRSSNRSLVLTHSTFPLYCTTLGSPPRLLMFTSLGLPVISKCRRMDRPRRDSRLFASR